MARKGPGRQVVSRLPARSGGGRILTLTLEVGQKLPVRVSQGLDLVIVIGVAHRPEEVEQWASRMATHRTRGPIVLGCPTRPGPAGNYGTYRWSLQGEMLKVSSGVNFRGLQRELLARVYPDRLESWPATRATVRQAVDYVLAAPDELGLPRAGRVARPAASPAELLRRAFVDTGVVRKLSSHGSYNLYEATSQGGNGGVARNFTELMQRLYGGGESGPRRVALKSVLNWMAQSPRGWKGQRAFLYLSLALQCRHRDLRLVGPEERVLELSRSHLRTALSEAGRWSFEFCPATQAEWAFLVGLWRRFGPLEAEIELSHSVWERVRRRLAAWYEGLPLWTRSSRESHSPNAQSLLDLGRQARDAQAREFLGRKLPGCFRAQGIPEPAEQDVLLDRIDSARLELEGFVQAQCDRLASRIHTIFTGRVLDLISCRDWLEQGGGQWVSGMPPGTASVGDVSAWAQGLRFALLNDSAPEERWFVALPMRLSLPPVAAWEYDLSEVFLSRILRAKMELELWPMLRLLPLPEPGQERVEALGRWIRAALAATSMSRERSEEIVFDLLEELHRGTWRSELS